ncbi:MAG: hypothetical protein D6794_10850 [Deltaproteobacteria bacterium]|nr:MAG: hypothetical protein D6794_10850 [Deltaproteobacteria bacterium]
MTGSRDLFLVAHTGELGLAVPVDLLCEVVEGASVLWLDGDGRHGGRVEWNGATLGVLQPAQLQGWGEAFRSNGLHLLILQGEGSTFGMLVDDIVGIFPAEGFILHPLPAPFSGPGMFYRRLAVRDDRVMVVCDGRFAAGLVGEGGLR